MERSDEERDARGRCCMVTSGRGRTGMRRRSGVRMTCGHSHQRVGRAGVGRHGSNSTAATRTGGDSSTRFDHDDATPLGFRRGARLGNERADRMCERVPVRGRALFTASHGPFLPALPADLSRRTFTPARSRPHDRGGAQRSGTLAHGRRTAATAGAPAASTPPRRARRRPTTGS
jgi:hypothetical protein